MDKILLEKTEIFQSGWKLDNYLVIDDCKKPKNTCIYLTGNAFYPSNNLEDFTETILNKNRFEFFKTRMIGIERHIFIRDISKNFYFGGINKDINSLEKLIELLKNLTKDCNKIMTIGCSAGGTSAISIGLSMNVNKIIAMNPIIDFFDTADFPLSSKDSYSEVFKAIENPKMSNYTFLPELILKNKEKAKNNLIIFSSSDCEEDKRRMSKFDENIVSNVIKIKTNIHGVAVDPINIPYFYKKFNKLKRENFKNNKPVSVNHFSFYLLGISFIYFYLKLNFNRRGIKKLILKLYKKI